MNQSQRMNFSSYDVAILRFVHHHRLAGFDTWLYWFSYINTFVSISILLALFLLSFRNKLRLAVFLKALAVFIMSALIVWLVKSAWFRQRPFITYSDIQKLSEAGSSSFPSGHTTEAFAMAWAITMLSGKWWITVSVYCLAIFIAYSRMALGVHYPSDVLGGIILGTMIGFLTLKLAARITWQTKKT